MKRIALLASLLSALVAPSRRADAAFTITFAQVGNDVVASGNGTITTAGLSFSSSGPGGAGVMAAGGFVLVGPAGASARSLTQYNAYFAGPANFGGGGIARPDSGTGSFGGLVVGGNLLDVSTGYSSGSPILDSTSTYRNQTIAGLGLVAGTYIESYSATRGGPAIDSFTIQIGPAAVPEPASSAMLGLALAGVGAVARSRRRA